MPGVKSPFKDGYNCVTSQAEDKAVVVSRKVKRETLQEIEATNGVDDNGRILPGLILPTAEDRAALSNKSAALFVPNADSRDFHDDDDDDCEDDVPDDELVKTLLTAFPKKKKAS